MADINRIFSYLENWKAGNHTLKLCKTLMVCPVAMRLQIETLIDKEIKAAKAKKPALIIVKCNSLSDSKMIEKLQRAIDAGVPVKLIVRGIYCPVFSHKKNKQAVVTAISIVDEYLEHGRVMIFGDGKHEKVFISSPDWMVRNLDHRVEAAVEINHPKIKQELKEIIQIQLKDNVKARTLDAALSNTYVQNAAKKSRSQIETYNYLMKKSQQ